MIRLLTFSSLVIPFLLFSCETGEKEVVKENIGNTQASNAEGKDLQAGEKHFAELYGMLEEIDKAHKAYPDLIPTAEDANEASAVARFASTVVESASGVNWDVRKHSNILIVYGEIESVEQKALVDALTEERKRLNWDPIFLHVVKSRVESVTTSMYRGRKITTTRHEPEKEVVLFETEI